MNTPAKHKRLYPLVWITAALLTSSAAYASETHSPTAPADAQTAAAESSNCLQHTGSRIRRSEARPCVAAPGQVITREEIERTGATTTADAIRRLSPSVR
ncbi:Plug domain-containing protein [Sinimarinibacterium thermocellulolyticum]|uniref:Plug domain-containing protein n=1 Tax=Sinimarinibacterium thermocellulolyticum TaxID=3170016 RepID=A0ABV2AA79_9GAMM